MNILEEAATLIGGDRRRDYGTALENFERIARYWNEWLAKKLKAPLDHRDVGVLMVLLKLAREQNTPKRDNLVDACGYLGCLEQADAEAKTRVEAADAAELDVEPPCFPATAFTEAPAPSEETPIRRPAPERSVCGVVGCGCRGTR